MNFFALSVSVSVIFLSSRQMCIRDSYNRCTGSHMKLDRDSDVLVYYTGSSAALDPASDTITIDGQQFDIRHELDSMIRNSNIVASINGGCFIIVKDISVIEKILETSAELSGDDQSFISFNYKMCIRDRAINMGADDFVAKPFDMDMLLAVKS